MTLLELLAALVVAGCVVASGYRLREVARAFGVEPEGLAQALRRGVDPGQLLAALRAEGESTELDALLVGAAEGPVPELPARLNEALGEVDDRLQRWARVPRVAARLASTSGFLLASLALRRGLADTDAIAPELRDAFLYRALGDAVGTVALGILGAIACLVLHGRAHTLRRLRAAGADAIVAEIEAAARPSNSARSPNHGLPGGQPLV